MSFDLISLVLQAGLIVKLVLLTLLAFSITSLGIIATKWRELRAADQDSEAFLEVYQRRGFSEAYDAARHLDRSPLAVVFLTTGQALQDARERNATDHTRDQLLRQLARSIEWGAAAQARRLERGLPEAGQASLSVVGPGIAEALVATAVGLLAAIPAMMAYNSFGGRIDGILAMLDRFSTQFQEDLTQLVQTQAIHSVRGSDVERVTRVEER